MSCHSPSCASKKFCCSSHTKPHVSIPFHVLPSCFFLAKQPRKVVYQSISVDLCSFSPFWLLTRPHALPESVAGPPTPSTDRVDPIYDPVHRVQPCHNPFHGFRALLAFLVHSARSRGFLGPLLASSSGF